MRVRVALALLAASAALARGQAPEEPRPVFPGGVEWVTVDVVVLDRDGEPVRGLRASDFVLEEDGVPQAISTFEAIDAVPATATPGAAAPSAPGPPTSPSPPPVRVFVVVFDDLHLDAESAPRARAAARLFLEGLAERDRVTLVAPGRGTWWHARVPEGRDALLVLLKSLAPRARTAERPNQWMTDDEAVRFCTGDPTARALVVRRARAAATDVLSFREPGSLEDQIAATARYVCLDVERRTAGTLDALVRALAALTGARGRKSVVLVSSGFVRDPREPRFRDVVAEARRANVAIHFVDARGLPAVGPDLTAEAAAPTALEDTPATLGSLDRASEGSESLAADTGGASIRKRNDVGAALAAIARESRSYYLLGYPAPPGGGTRFRRIEVRVAREGARVRARRGYYPAPAPAEGEGDPGRRVVQRALDTPLDSGEVPLRAATFVLGEKGPGKLRVLLTTEVDLRAVALREEGQASVGTIDFALAIVEGETGTPRRTHETIAVRLDPEERQRARRDGLAVTREAALAPGIHQARVVVRDRTSGKVGSLSHDFAVPPAGGLRLSTLVLSDRLRAGGAREPELGTRRTFAPSGTLHGRFEVHGAGRGTGGRPSVAAAFAVQHADGRLLAASEATPILPAADGTLRRTFGIPLDGAPEGRYEIVVVVEDATSGRRAEARETFALETPDGSRPPAPPSPRRE